MESWWKLEGRGRFRCQEGIDALLRDTSHNEKDVFKENADADEI
jgi:hypothetical protein